MSAPRDIPFDVALAMHDWLEMCRAAHDEPTPREAEEYLQSLLAAHKELNDDKE